MSPIAPRHASVAACLVALGLLGIAVVGSTLSRAGEETLRPAQVLSQRGTPAAGQMGVLVLVGGTMVEGRIGESASGYLVELPRGKYVVPFDRVLLAARTPKDAYEKQRKTMNPPSPSNHYRLAQWCLRYQMMEQAKMELRDALALAGNFEPARELLKDLEQLERPNDPRHGRVQPVAPKTTDGFDVPETVSIAGLTPEAAADFTSRVQPLLVNGCGNARCHGGSAENGFHLENVRFGRAGTRALTQQNLAAALKYVDHARPASSPLLTLPSGVHGSTRRPVFDGVGGRRQRELLAAWIEAVAENVADEPTPAIAVRPPAPSPFPAASRPAASVTPERREPDLLDRILDEERPDAFDPDAFNRRSR